MEIKKEAFAGTLESNDLLVQVAPGESGREINIDSKVSLQFFDRIEELVVFTLDKFHVENIVLKITDMGALDFTIQSRVETALFRAGAEK